MNSKDFYKELYFREIDRKHQITNDVNIPLLLLSAVVSIQSFLYSNEIAYVTLVICLIISIITALFGSWSLFYLFKSFSNSFKTHRYKEIADAKSYHIYELELKKKFDNSEAETKFQEYVIKELADCAGYNFNVNRKRTEDLAKAKIGIFFCVIFTLILCITFSISILSNMPEEQKPTTDNTAQQPSAETQSQGPQSVYIQNSAPASDTVTKKEK